MAQRPRYYLDHAATSWPKPPGSLEACIAYQTHLGVAAGRGVYESAEHASAILRDCRRVIARTIHAPNERDIALCSNGTQALNAAILGLLAADQMKGSHVVTTTTEHNSVLRPLALAAKRFGIRWTAVPGNVVGWVDPQKIANAMQGDTKLVIVNHGSNVTGAIQDIETMAQIAKSKGAIFMVDAAQTLGYLPIDVQQSGIDILAAPGHKGAGGMLGTGLLYVHSRLQSSFEPVWIGGTGTISDSVDGPFDWQSAIESGNSNLPGIASLKAGLEWLEAQDAGEQRQRLTHWSDQIIHAIRKKPTLKLIGPDGQPRLPVVSLTSERASCHEMAMFLDAAFHVEVRSGLHCAGLIHDDIGTKSLGGTLRISLGHTSTEADIQAVLAGVESLDD